MIDRAQRVRAPIRAYPTRAEIALSIIEIDWYKKKQYVRQEWYVYRGKYIDVYFWR